jgi:glycogen debranching enzyme
MRFDSVCILLLACGTAALAQDLKLGPTPSLKLAEGPQVIRRRVQAGQPFTVAGPRGVVLGQQEGTFEAWILPVKLLSHFTIRAEVEGYSVPIDLNADAAEIEVRPDHTTITYSHIAFTVRQTMFAPEETADGTGAVVLFEIDSVRPMDLTFSFTPEMRPMWPQPGKGTPSAEWIESQGSYILHTDFPDLAGAVTIPGAKSGIMAPYQEKPQVHPLELKLHFDPKRQAGQVFPLLMAVGQTAETATNAALTARLAELNRSLPQLYAAHVAKYEQMQNGLTLITTPDASLNQAFSWAEISIEQLRAFSHPAGETALVAGYYSSGDSARPGFGWYFGRDALYTLYAVNGMGDFSLTRDELQFLIKRQRADGKMMHEYSQTAAFVDWNSFPYEYAAADATPLFLTAMLDYVKASGDVEFLRQHRDAVEQAWKFETTHDSDGDGIYDNSQGTGWVESWPGGQPHQEIYLALLDQQASAAMASLSSTLGDAATSQLASARAAQLAVKIEAEYFEPKTHQYAFSRNADGSLDRTATLYPTVAWWNEGSSLKTPEASFRTWDSHLFSTDWGARDVAENDPVYDPISYHQGSVWPLFTGWASLADYRSGRTLSGYAHLMQNADQTTSQDLGAVTELLSGDFFQPFGRSTSHQLWSSAMVIVPVLRGLFGIEMDAAANSLTVDPRLPADWNSAELTQLHVGKSVCSVSYKRDGPVMRVSLKTLSGPSVQLKSHSVGSQVAGDTTIVPLPDVEVAMPHGLPLAGARTAQMKVLAQSTDGHSSTFDLEGQAGSVVELALRLNKTGTKVQATGATLGGTRADGLQRLLVTFPTGVDYQVQRVVLSW